MSSNTEKAANGKKANGKKANGDAAKAPSAKLRASASMFEKVGSDVDPGDAGKQGHTYEAAEEESRKREQDKVERKCKEKEAGNEEKPERRPR